MRIPQTLETLYDSPERGGFGMQAIIRDGPHLLQKRSPACVPGASPTQLIEGTVARNVSTFDDNIKGTPAGPHRSEFSIRAALV